MQVDRLYHSGALLLPDGRVLLSGSNPARRVDELRIELYHPPYLFRSWCPTIEGAPDRVSYGDALEVSSPDAPDVDEVVLVQQASTTHCLTTDQRLVELPIDDRTDTTISARLPDNPNLLPPAHYMLFVLSDGVPSRAPFVRVGHTPIR